MAAEPPWKVRDAGERAMAAGPHRQAQRPAGADDGCSPAPLSSGALLQAFSDLVNDDDDDDDDDRDEPWTDDDNEDDNHVVPASVPGLSPARGSDAKARLASGPAAAVRPYRAGTYHHLPPTHLGAGTAMASSSAGMAR